VEAFGSGLAADLASAQILRHREAQAGYGWTGLSRAGSAVVVFGTSQ
jgi:hypothetical protein